MTVLHCAAGTVQRCLVDNPDVDTSCRNARHTVLAPERASNKVPPAFDCAQSSCGVPHQAEDREIHEHPGPEDVRETVAHVRLENEAADDLRDHRRDLACFATASSIA